jgi:hypothetical protein
MSALAPRLLNAAASDLIFSVNERASYHEPLSSPAAGQSLGFEAQFNKDLENMHRYIPGPACLRGVYDELG